MNVRTTFLCLSMALVSGSALGYATRERGGFETVTQQPESALHSNSGNRRNRDRPQAVGDDLYLVRSEVDELLDPRSPSYDPIYLMRTKGTVSRIVFANEPVDPLWAPKMEAFVEEIFEADFEKISPGAEIVDNECRTSMCRVQLSASEEELLVWQGEWRAVLAEQTALQAGPMMEDGRRSIVFHLPFSNENREVDAQRALYNRHRRYLIDRLGPMGALPEGIGEDE